MSSMIDTLRLRAHEMRDEFLSRYARDLVITDRLKFLLAGTFVIIVLSALLGLSSFVDNLEDNYTTSQTDLERIEEQTESISWEERENQSHVLKTVLQDKLWAAQTTGLAEAGFERWLRSSLSRHKMQPRQLQITRVPIVSQAGANATDNPLAGVQKMTVKILLPFDQAGLMGFLRDISTSDKTIVTERLIARSGRNPRIEIDVSAFYHFHESLVPGEAR
jgi:hypothetical protein